MIVVLTALDIEYEAFRERLFGVEKRRHRAGTIFEVGTLDAKPDRQVALGLTGMGNTSAATLAERAIEEFRPGLMMFVGIAGARRDWLKAGDVVVADKIYAYHGGKSTDEGFKARPRSWQLSHRLENEARQVMRAKQWQQSLNPTSRFADPEVHFGPIAAGEVLMDSRNSVESTRLDWNYNDAIAVDMEGAGFAHAAHLNDSVPSISVRGISDHADGHKEQADTDKVRLYAARNAAAFAIALAIELPDDTDDTDDDHRTAATTPTPAQVFNNNATGNATVRNQIGSIGTFNAGETR